ncbi:MAG: hypothetical protein MZV63_13350 [Marinilabiliales bacterium]|nr:hypothetical protein [Marinilabiliales bacterium]
MKIAISIPDSVVPRRQEDRRGAEALPERGHRRGRPPIPEGPRNSPA